MGEEDKKAEESTKQKTEGEMEMKESKDVKEEKAVPPIPKPPQAQDIVFSVFMHCEGCARKVRRCLKGLQGVETVDTDCRTHKVVVKGEKADPMKVLDRLQRKIHRRVQLISPIPEPPAPIPEPVEKPKTEDAKPPQILTTVVLKVHMHCEACAQEIKRRIQRMKAVESVDPDLKSSQVTVKGAIDPAALVAFVHRRTGKHAAIVRQEPEITPENNESEVAVEEVKEEKKADGGDGVESDKKAEEESKAEEEKPAAATPAVEGEAEVAAPADADPVAEEGPKMVEVKKNEYHYYPQRYIMEMYPYAPPMIGDMAHPPPHMVVDAYPAPVMMGQAYPPQMFSDENPNACSVM